MCARFTILIALLLAAPLWTAAAPSTWASPCPGPADFDHVQIEPAGRPGLEVFDDFDGDGIKDVLLADGRLFSFFLSSRGGPGPKPDLVLTAPDDAVLFDVSNLGGGQIRKVVIAKKDGVYIFGPDADGNPVEEKIVEARSRLLPERVDALSFVNFVRDITGDGPEDILFADLESLHIFERDRSGGFVQWGEIPFLPRSEIHAEPLSETGGLRETLYVPLVMAGGSKEDRRLILYDGSNVRIVRKEEDGVCRELSTHCLVERRSKEASERDVRMRFHTNVFFDDLDGDGRGDLAVCNNSHGEISFYTGIDREQPDDHDFCIRVEGNTFLPIFSDLNNDGFKDLILPTTGKIGLFTVLKVFFTSRFDMNYLVFYNRQKPLFRQIPDDTRTLSFPLSFSTSAKGLSVESVLIRSFRGDFDGDGRCDFLLRGEKNRVRVFRGLPNGTFSEEPDMVFPVKIVPKCFHVNTRTPDLNGDGRADLYLHQKSPKVERWDIYLSTE